MKLLETVRSWSSSSQPPAYDAVDEPLHPPPRRQPARRQRSQVFRWLLTFEKQWLLIHVLAAFSCFALMFTSAALFVTVTFDNFDESRPTWLGSAVGMISLVASGSLFKKLSTVYQTDPSLTPEQHSTQKFIWTVAGVLGQAFAGMVVLATAFSLKVPDQPSSRLRLERSVAYVAATLCFVAAAYDMLRICLDRRDAYDDDDNWQDDDLLNDAAERGDTNLGAVRLE